MAAEWEKENRKLQDEIAQIQDYIAKSRDKIRSLVSENAVKGEELGKLYVKRYEMKKNSNNSA